jgi:hypothetical protein
MRGEWFLPQIWMTYEELAGMLNCSIMGARERARLECLDRKISRDGKKRAKLSPAMVGIFIEHLKSIDVVTDQAVDKLRQIHGLLRESRQPGRASSWLDLSQQGRHAG